MEIVRVIFFMKNSLLLRYLLPISTQGTIRRAVPMLIQTLTVTGLLMVMTIAELHPMLVKPTGTLMVSVMPAKTVMAMVSSTMWTIVLVLIIPPKPIEIAMVSVMPAQTVMVIFIWMMLMVVRELQGHQASTLMVVRILTVTLILIAVILARQPQAILVGVVVLLIFATSRLRLQYLK